MASYRLTDNEVTDFAMAANDYVQLESPYTEILPIKRIKDCYVHKWYVGTEVRAPLSSKDGRSSEDVRMARTEGEANVTSFVHTFEIPRVEVTMAQNAGVPIWSENIGAAIRKMNATVSHLIFRGNSAWDKVDITGMYGGGTATTVDLTAVLWNTATSPIIHVASAYTDLTAAGYAGPFNWALGSACRGGMTVKYGAGDPAAIELLGPYEIPKENVKFYHQQADGVAETQMNLSPMGMPPTGGDDFMWFVYKKDPNYAYLAEVMPITTTINPELDFRRQCYHGRVEWRGTVAIVQSTSINYEHQGDLA